MYHTRLHHAAGLDLLIARALYPVRAGRVWSQSSLNCPQIKHVSLLPRAHPYRNGPACRRSNSNACAGKRARTGTSRIRDGRVRGRWDRQGRGDHASPNLARFKKRISHGAFEGWCQVPQAGMALPAFTTP